MIYVDIINMQENIQIVRVLKVAPGLSGQKFRAFFVALIDSKTLREYILTVSK